MTWGGNSFFNVIIISGGGVTGLFQYSGAPGHGNPPILWAAPPGVTHDPFGNSLPVNGGIASEQSGNIAQLVAGEVIFETTSFPPTNPASIGGGGIAATTAQLVLTSGNVSTDTASTLDITSGTGTTAQIALRTSQALIVTGVAGAGTSALLEVQGAAALKAAAAPTAVSGYAEPYASPGVTQLQYVDAAGGIYSTGESRQFSTVSQLVNSVTLAPVKNLAGTGNLAVAVASGQGYIIRAHIVYSTTSAAGAPVFAFQTGAGLGSPNTSLVKFFQGAAVTSNAGGSTTSWTGPTLAAGTFGILDLEAEVQFSSAGTFTLETACTVAADTFTIVGGHMTSKPITN